MVVEKYPPWSRRQQVGFVSFITIRRRAPTGLAGTLVADDNKKGEFHA
jgi:hypothetical protein